MPRVKVRDLEMFYSVYGDVKAKPVVLLHGFLSTGKIFDPIIPILSEHYRVIVPDLRGHGLTKNPKDRIVHAELAEDTAAFLSVLGIKRAHFCGFSSGGMHLLFLALNQPELFQSLTLLSSTYTFNEHAQKKVKKVHDGISETALHEIAHMHSPYRKDLNYARILLDQWLESVLRPKELPFNPEDLRKITIPTLILHGDRDMYFPLEIPLNMYKAMSNAQLGIVPNCNHNLDYLPLFSPVILDFIRINSIQKES